MGEDVSEKMPSINIICAARPATGLPKEGFPDFQITTSQQQQRFGNVAIGVKGALSSTPHGKQIPLTR